MFEARVAKIRYKSGHFSIKSGCFSILVSRKLSQLRHGRYLKNLHPTEQLNFWTGYAQSIAKATSSL